METLTRLKRFLRDRFALFATSLRGGSSRFAYLLGEGGFNIMDVTAAVAITATLAAVVVPSVKGSMDNARVASLMQEVTNIRNGLLKFNSDTNQMPRIVGTSDVTDINGNIVLTTHAIDGSSGLRVNDKPIVNWQGAYMDKDIGLNPFGGDYFLVYDTEGTGAVVAIDVSDLLPPIITGGTVAPALNRDSAVFVVTALPPEVIAKLDSSLDDGNPTKGIIRDVSVTTGSAVSRMAVIVLPGVSINAGTGLPQ